MLPISIDITVIIIITGFIISSPIFVFAKTTENINNEITVIIIAVIIPSVLSSVYFHFPIAKYSKLIAVLVELVALTN